jgi:hypothetical protein
MLAERSTRVGLQSEGDYYESVDHFKYLGSMITTVNDVSVDINARFAAGKRAFFAS